VNFNLGTQKREKNYMFFHPVLGNHQENKYWQSGQESMTESNLKKNLFCDYSGLLYNEMQQNKLIQIPIKRT